jgi:hypothetical protein
MATEPSPVREVGNRMSIGRVTLYDRAIAFSEHTVYLKVSDLYHSRGALLITNGEDEGPYIRVKRPRGYDVTTFTKHVRIVLTTMASNKT